MWNGSKVQEITYEQAREFCKGQKNMIVKPAYKYYALFGKNEMVSMLGLQIKNNKVKFHCNVTPQHLRGNGYFTTLLQWAIKRYEGEDLYADCLEASKDIYIKQGFTLKEIKHYKSFDIYKVERRAQK